MTSDLVMAAPSNVVEPINVFKDLRQELGLSHAQLAKKIPISKQALIRLEQGMYTEPLPSVTDFYVKYHDVSELQMRDAYEGFQHAKRLANKYYFGDDLTSESVNIHPFIQLRFRVNKNTTQVAKDLCLPQPSLVYFERRYRVQQSIPRTLEYVLYEVGYSTAQVKVFKNNYELFRKGAFAND